MSRSKTRFDPIERALTLQALASLEEREAESAGRDLRFFRSDVAEVAEAEEYARRMRLQALEPAPRKPPASAEAISPLPDLLVRDQTG